MSSLFSLFNIFAALYLLRSIQLAITIWRERAAIRREPLTARKKHLAEQAAFFIAVPIAVLFHELAHALATRLVGGEVVEFAYRVFWGYVIPAGDFSAAETWFIAVAGTLGSLAFGLALYLATRHSPASPVRYFGLRAFRFQIYFSLLYYPLFTLLGFDGDWRTIYAFGRTPLLSAVTAALHAGTLVIFWRADRQGWFEAPAFESVEAQEAFAQLVEAAANNPQDAELALQAIDGLRRGGASKRAAYALQAFLAAHPESGTAQLEAAALYEQGKAQVPKEAARSAQQALALGLPTLQQRAYAHELLGRHALQAGDAQSAVNHLSEALASLSWQDPRTLPAPSPAGPRFRTLLLRNQAHRRLGQHDLAYEDLYQAVLLATDTGNEPWLLQAQQELETLQKHAGRSFAPLPDGPHLQGSSANL